MPRPLPAFDDQGFPNLEAAYTNALLVDSLYHDDNDFATVFCSLYGAQLLDRSFVSDRFPPGYLVIQQGTDVLIAISGTVNNVQWLAHGFYAFFPTIFGPLQTWCNGSFKIGEQIIEPTIFDVLQPWDEKTIRITGHSYGAGAGFILANYMAEHVRPPRRVEVMTFGEPKSFTNTELITKIPLHFRIGFEEDVVNELPPQWSFLLGFGRLISLTKIFGQLHWSHHGRRFGLNADGFEDITRLERLAVFTDLLGLVTKSELTSTYHPMDTGYLPAISRLWDRANA